VKNLLKFISIGLVLMVVVFSQVTQQSSAVEAADVSEDDIEFMDKADAVVKSYKASSADTTVYLYVRDGALNTTHTGTTEWASTGTTSLSLADDTSVFTLDGNAITTLLKGEKAASGINEFAGNGNDAKKKVSQTIGPLATTYSSAGTDGGGAGLTVNVVLDGSGAATPAMVTGGSGYTDNEVVSIDGCLLSISASDCGTAVTVTVNLVAGVANAVAGDYTKTEDSDQGIVGGPNLYMGSTTPLKLNSLTQNRERKEKALIRKLTRKNLIKPPKL
jgi:hypothetical protein